MVFRKNRVKPAQAEPGVRHVHRGPLSWLLMWWCIDVVRRGWGEPLKATDSPQLPNSLRCRHVAAVMRAAWQRELDSARKPSLERAFWAVCRGRVLLGAALSVVNGALTTVGRPLLLQAFIEAMASPESARAWRYVVALAAVLLLEGLTMVNSKHVLGDHLCALFGAATASLLQAKGQRLSSAEREATERTLIMNDVTRRMAEIPAGLCLFFMCAAALVGGAAVLALTLGWTGLFGLGIMVLSMLCSSHFARRAKRAERDNLEQADRRLNITNAILHGIKAVKLCAWEREFVGEVLAARRVECHHILRLKVLHMSAVQLGRASPAVAAGASFVLLAVLGHDMEPARVFAALTVFHGMRMALIMLPMCLHMLGTLRVSLRRMQHFLLLPEAVPLAPAPAAEAGAGAGADTANVLVELDGACFDWPAADADAVDPDQDQDEGDANKKKKKKKKKRGEGEEKETATAAPEPSPRRTAVDLEGTFLRVHRAQVMALVGPVGCGKTALLRALMGDMQLSRGRAFAFASSGTGTATDTDNDTGTGTGATLRVGYVPQKAFVLSGTVRHNITLGRTATATATAAAAAAAAADNAGDEDAVLLQTVLRRSALADDIASLPNGLDTEVGESGVTLSGGQQQRLSLARALFGKPDLIIADDPLAAVDGTVARAVFDGLCEAAHNDGCAVVLALNQLVFLRGCDEVCLLRGGGISERMRPDQRQDAERHAPTLFAMMQRSDDTADNNNSDNDTGGTGGTASPAASASANASASAKAGGEQGSAGGAAASGSKAGGGAADYTLVRKEQKAKGAVSGDVLRWYWRGMGSCCCGSMRFAVFCVAVCVMCYAAMAASDRWLAVWIEALQDGTDDDMFYTLVYAGICTAYLVLLLANSVFWARGSVRASESLHSACLTRIMRAPMGWFESTPSGRTISRLSSDLSNVDINLGSFVDSFFQFACTLVVLCAMVAWVVPPILAVIAAGAAVYGVQVVAVDRSNREAKRYANAAMSPVATQLSEASQVRGRALIRASQTSAHFSARFHDAFDDYNRHLFLSNSLINWGMLISYLISTVLSACAAMAIYYSVDHSEKRSRRQSATIGLCLTYSFLIPYFLLHFSFIIQVAKVGFTCLERILQLTGEEVPQEAALALPTDPPPGEFARVGRVEFRDVTLVYRPGLPPALRGVSFVIEPGMKVGVVGRTGAGKSTLLLLLLRVQEATGGAVLVDGCDIAKVGLQLLRSSISCIPQEAMLIAGDVRRNIDPWGRHGPGALRKVLAQVGLARAARAPAAAATATGPATATATTAGASAAEDEVGLSTDVMTLSSGQRQLVCFARALLANSRIIVMDEPTSNVDSATDEQVTALVKEHFKEVTLLTIAHRLNTVASYDRILTLGDGRVLEFASPEQLLADPSSHFAGMMQAQRKGSPASSN